MCEVTNPSTRCSPFAGSVPVMWSSIWDRSCSRVNDLSVRSDEMFCCWSASLKILNFLWKKKGHQISHVAPRIFCQARIHMEVWKTACACALVCERLWASLHCFCRYPFCFDLPCVSPVYFGGTWAALERGLSAEFPPQAKFVITFPGCHHSIAIHHYLELFGYIEPRDGDRHC